RAAAKKPSAWLTVPGPIALTKSVPYETSRQPDASHQEMTENLQAEHHRVPQSDGDCRSPGPCGSPGHYPEEPHGQSLRERWRFKDAEITDQVADHGPECAAHYRPAQDKTFFQECALVHLCLRATDPGTAVILQQSSTLPLRVLCFVKHTSKKSSGPHL